MTSINKFWQLFRLPWIVPATMLTVAAGAFQGIGLTMFLPLINLINDKVDANEFPLSYLRTGFEIIGIPFEIGPVLVCLVILNLVGLAFIFAFKSILMGYSFMRFVHQTNMNLFNSHLHSTWHHLTSQASGEISNLLISEVISAGRALTHLAMMVTSIIQVIIFFAISLTLSWQLVVVIITMAVIGALIVRPFQNLSYRQGVKVTESKNVYGFHIVDHLKNIKLIKVTGTESRTSKIISDLQTDVCDNIIKRQINFAGTHFIIQFLPVLVVAAVIYLTQDILAVESATILVLLVLLVRMFPLMTQTQQEYQAYLMALPSLEAVDRTIAQNIKNREIGPDEPQVFTGLKNGIRFENVSFKFPDSEVKVVKNVEFEIAKSQMTAIVGGSGAGKSTIIDLLCDLRQPSEGQITVDGVDLRTIEQTSWRHSIGYVTQDIVIFNDSLKNNITLAHPETPEEDIWNVLQIAQLEDFVRSLPDGLSTVMGESGIRFSGGQKQRLALARALIGKPELLLLDEATSALDNESERIVQKAIDNIASEFTIVVVAHRLSTIRRADQICVMDAGKIIEKGTYEELQAKGGRFAQLHDLQFSE